MHKNLLSNEFIMQNIGGREGFTKISCLLCSKSFDGETTAHDWQDFQKHLIKYHLRDLLKFDTMIPRAIEEKDLDPGGFLHRNHVAKEGILLVLPGFPPVDPKYWQVRRLDDKTRKILVPWMRTNACQHRQKDITRRHNGQYNSNCWMQSFQCKIYKDKSDKRQHGSQVSMPLVRNYPVD